MSEDLTSILEQCLSQIEEGRARPESFLYAYPHLAGELKPLLQAAVELWSVPKPTLEPEARDRIEAQFLSAAGASRRLRPARKWRLPIPAHWRWALLGLGAAIVLIFLLTVLVDAAAGALPGSPLYPLKTATEQAWLGLTPAYAEPALHLEFAQRRLEEFEALASQGTYEPALLDAMIEQTEAALGETEGLPSSVAVPVLEGLRGFSAHQRGALTRLQASAPSPVQNRLTTALQAGEGLDARAEREIELRRSSGEPPGQTWPPPGQTRTPPSYFRTPGVPATPPGQILTPPGQERTPPGQEQKAPEPTKTPKPDKVTNTPKPDKATKTPKP